MSAIAARVRSDTPTRPLRRVDGDEGWRCAGCGCANFRRHRSPAAGAAAIDHQEGRAHASQPDQRHRFTRATDTSSMIRRLTSRRGTARCMSNLHPERIRDNNVDIPLPLRFGAGAPPARPFEYLSGALQKSPLPLRRYSAGTPAPGRCHAGVKTSGWSPTGKPRRRPQEIRMAAGPSSPRRQRPRPASLPSTCSTPAPASAYSLPARPIHAAAANSSSSRRTVRARHHLVLDGRVKYAVLSPSGGEDRPPRRARQLLRRGGRADQPPHVANAGRSARPNAAGADRRAAQRHGELDRLSVSMSNRLAEASAI